MLRKDNPIFKDYFAPFSTISNNTSASRELVKSVLEAVKLDIYTQRAYRQEATTPSSIDALYFTENYNYLIEFKDSTENSLSKSRNRKKTRNKFEKTPEILKNKAKEEDIFSTSYRAVLVYNFSREEELDKNLGSALAKGTSKQYYPCALEDFLHLYENIYTVNPQEFDNNFIAEHFGA